MSGSTTPTTTTDRPQLVHRLVAVLLALLTVGSALGLAAKPAAALPPGTPRMLATLPTDHELLVAWSLPDTGGKAPTANATPPFPTARPRLRRNSPKTCWIPSTPGR